ncbi:MAG TPA: 3-dehydroquinate synthase [Burkholderiaceae bacterium]|nr:3-dehydroquinate synthase [Burkholderiaceae bacterium]
MRTVDVSLPAARADRSYPIHIGPGLVDRLDAFIAPLAPTSIVVVSDATVDGLYGARARAACAKAVARGRVAGVVIAGGEGEKTLATFGRVIDGLVEARADRGTLLVALGGGVVGDIAGFAAAAFMRGIRFAQVPTTLLAQVDSSVGGKTGVNHVQGKNLVGAFHQPAFVASDTQTLKSLPPREVSAGLAEILKHGLLADAAYFDAVARDTPAILALDDVALAAAIAGSCEIKAAIVARDERESGDRALLNLGHTFGHAIEALTGYERWLHGEAVGCGLCLAADLSARLGLVGGAQVARVVAAVGAARLPVRIAGLSREAAVASMRGDKKASAGRIRFIVLEAIGRAVQREVPDADLDATLVAAGYV